MGGSQTIKRIAPGPDGIKYRGQGMLMNVEMEQENEELCKMENEEICKTFNDRIETGIISEDWMYI